MPELTYDPADHADYRERFANWKTAVGLQAVDNLEPSEYLTRLAQEHIEGKKTIDEVELLVESYYEKAENRRAAEKTRQDEADLVSTRITKLLETKSFTLTENSLKTIHKNCLPGLPHIHLVDTACMISSNQNAFSMETPFNTDIGIC